MAYEIIPIYLGSELHPLISNNQPGVKSTLQKTALIELRRVSWGKKMFQRTNRKGKDLETHQLNKFRHPSDTVYQKPVVNN